MSSRLSKISLQEIDFIEQNIKEENLDDVFSYDEVKETDHLYKIDVDGHLAGAFNFDTSLKGVAYLEIYVLPKFRKRWATRQFLTQMYNIAFNELKVDRICTVTKNKAIGKMMAQEGFEPFKLDEGGVYFVLNKPRWKI